jgi:hypothetical protein
MKVGSFNVNGNKFDDITFTKLIVKWSFSGISFANSKIYSHIPVAQMHKHIRSGEDKNFMILAYCFALNLLAARISYGFPAEVLRHLNERLQSDLEKMSSNGVPAFPPPARKLIGHLTPKYFKAWTVFFNEPETVSLGPTGLLLDDIIDFYELNDEPTNALNKLLISAELNSMLSIALSDFAKVSPKYIL